MRQGRSLVITPLTACDPTGTVVLDPLVQAAPAQLPPCTVTQIECKVTTIVAAATLTVDLLRADGGAIYSSVITLAGAKTYVLTPAIEWYPESATDTLSIRGTTNAGSLNLVARVHLKDF